MSKTTDYLLQQIEQSTDFREHYYQQLDEQETRQAMPESTPEPLTQSNQQQEKHHVKNVPH